MKKKKYKIPKLPRTTWHYIDSSQFSWFLYRPKYRLYGLLWSFHKTDVDDIISIPHGDCIEGKQKYQLNPYNGTIYNKKAIVGKITKNEFLRLWSDKKFLVYVNEARTYYLDKHPNKKLPDVPNIKQKGKATNSRNSSAQQYIVLLQSCIAKNSI